MRYITLFIFIFLIFNSYSQTQLDLLNLSYKKNSQSGLKEFYDNWQTGIKSYDYSDSLGLKKIANDIFIKFYNPFRLNEIGVGEKPDTSLNRIKYVIVQNRLDVYQVNEDSLNFDFHGRPNDTSIFAKDSLIDFRPNINLSCAKTLYLTKEYENILLDFLGDNHKPLGYGGIMNPAKSSGKSFKKQKFLNGFAIVLYGHWGGYWYLETHPKVYSITLNKSKTLAIIKYRLGYQGGDAIYEFKDNHWLFKEGGLTWIE